ncbi:MAG TPA: class I adenylate-forming enzyme family protein [Syntrophorhabdales bacterium]|nr:class I adenylate-forming enzyme family protein [Syntrophorhabdales bacterium]
MNLSEMLARNGRMYPDKVALIERVPSKGLRTEITWKEFDARVNRIANALRDRGIRKGDMVVHWMMNSIKWLEVYLGIVRTGAIVVPLNFRFNEKDFRHCVQVAEPKLAIVDEQFVDKVRSSGGRTLIKDSYIVNGRQVPDDAEGLETMITQSSPGPIHVSIEPHDPCGLYFTSGTTGTPKPILLTHNNMEHAAIIEVVHGLRTKGDIFVILKPLYHTGDFIHWLSSLILGATAVIQGDKITPKAIFEVMEEEKASVNMLLVPWIQDILTELETGTLKKENYDLSHWRLVMTGAQPVPPSLVKHLKEEFPSMLFEENYGLTEGTGPQSIHLGIENEHKAGSIGVPGFNWEAKVVDESGREVPQGGVGELLVRGNGVMKEYYKNPEKTAETIKDGWLYTGDLVKMDSDGFYWIVDRKKDLIISGGENIYPSEVEEIIQAQPKIHDVGVIALPDSRLGEVVAAVIKLKPGVPESDETEKELFQFFEKNLPRYKRPRRIIFDEVLRNPTGKIEKVKMRQKYLGNHES